MTNDARTERTPRQWFDQAQWSYGHGDRAAAFDEILEAAVATARRRMPEEPELDAFTAFLDDAIYEITLGRAGEASGLFVADAGRRVALAAWLHDWVERGRRDRASRPPIDFTAPPADAIEVTETGVFVPDAFIEGFATAVALAPENADAFPEAGAEDRGATR